MSRVLDALQRHASAHPTRVALEDEAGVLTYAHLHDAVERVAASLLEAAPNVVGLLADNGRAWILADLAALRAGVRIVPLPTYMSQGQIAHAQRAAGIDCVLTDDPGRFPVAVSDGPRPTIALGADMVCLRVPLGLPFARAPDGTQKITFTSGTTGEPKGVCLDLGALENTAEALCDASRASGHDRHLCVLPLATLLENIGGVYAAILAGATICVPGLADVGLSGSSGLDVRRLMAALGRWRASSAILVPQMAMAMVAACKAGVQPTETLRYLAVGGAPVPAGLLLQARALGLPLFEGYGLSECASVVALNAPDMDRVGSVGKPLPHVRLEFAADGEILVSGVRWLGYLGEPACSGRADSKVATGDLGYLDADGYLHLTARKKNMFITSFGRNVAPEWIESELVAAAPILQAAIFGESRPFNTAIVVPRPDATAECIAEAIECVNAGLPDYARVEAWLAATEPFSMKNGMATPNGRLRRAAIHAAYAAQIDFEYEHPLHDGAP